eukprot:775192-Amphidinium_carterae.1
MVCLYRCDFDEICKQLETGQLSGMAAASALRVALDRTTKPIRVNGLIDELGNQEPRRKLSADE